jgi:hypothetical protein
VTVLLAALAVTASAVLLPTTAAGEGKLRLRGDLYSEYTDNLFHYSDRLLDAFGSTNGPGERFDDIDETEDVVTRVRLRSDYTRKLGKRRDLRFFLDGAWFAHLDNDIADYGEVATGFEVDLTKRDHLELALEAAIDRFKKNYREVDSSVFSEASYDQTDVALGYSRRIGKRKRRLSTGAELRWRDRRYNETFESRDQDGIYLDLHTGYRLSKRVDGTTAVGFGDVEIDTVLDRGIPVDRSYEQVRLSQAFDVNLKRRVDVRVALDVRQRDYQTDEVTDLARNGREDERFRFRFHLSKGFKNDLTFHLRAAYLDNDSDRQDPTLETDETGYDETTVGIGLEYRF